MGIQYLDSAPTPGIQYLDEASSTPETASPTQASSPPPNILQRALAPFQRVRDAVSSGVTNTMQPMADALSSSPVGRAMGELPPNMVPLPIQMLAKYPRYAPEAFGQMAGNAAYAPNYLFGGTGAIPNRIARTLAGATLGGTLAAGEQHPSAANIALNTVLGGLGSGLTKVTKEGVQADIPQFPKSQLPQTTEELAHISPAKVSSLPPEARNAYFQARRSQLATEARLQRTNLDNLSHESKIALNSVHEQDMTALKQETERLTTQLQDESYQAALRLKQEDARPLLRAQSDRYASLVNDAVTKASKEQILFRPNELKTALEKEFAKEPEAFNLAYQSLNLEGLSNNPTALYTPQRILSEIDAIGSTVSRSPTSVYGYPDMVKDRLRNVLLNAMEQKGVRTDWIREAKTAWSAWKPVQKRLVSGTRLFENSEVVRDSFVNELMKHAMSDESKNASKIMGSLETYLGKDLATPMQPTIAQMSLVARKQLALEAARQIDAERMGLQVTGQKQQLAAQAAAGNQSLKDLELRTNLRIARAEKLWDVIRKMGYAGGALYAAKKLLRH